MQKNNVNCRYSSVEGRSKTYMHNHRIDNIMQPANEKSRPSRLSFDKNEMFCINKDHEHFSKNVFPDCEMCQRSISSDPSEHNKLRLMQRKPAFNDFDCSSAYLNPGLKTHTFMSLNSCGDDSYNSRRRRRGYSMTSFHNLNQHQPKTTRNYEKKHETEEEKKNMSGQKLKSLGQFSSYGYDFFQEEDLLNQSVKSKETNSCFSDRVCQHRHEHDHFLDHIK